MGIAPATSISSPTQPDHYYHIIKTVILDRQHPVSGLLPASTAITSHGNYTDAWVRDNVYSILAVWGLALAYRKSDDNSGRTYELEHRVVKLMRGLLFAMMQQAHKVEAFKQNQDPLAALHAKYDTATGSAVVGDGEWGHLQLDATAVFLLMLAQMIASGLNIIFTQDEVNFIQNLVYYIGRGYRTPDYGIWERGNKLNHGKPELNASSVGMVKAALEAMDGLNLYGVRGGQGAVIHVLPDEIARARITLESLLPRESGSKEVDAALLSVIGYPAFAIEDRDLVERTRQKIIDKLQGRYGCKRFLRDGHQTVIEDTTRLHYEPEELLQFEHIECEWPLFFAYLYVDALFRQDAAAIAFYHERLNQVAIPGDHGIPLLPELYYVPEAAIAAERATPHSQERLPNDNIPLVWAQSLYLLGQMINDGLLALQDIDPLGRHRRVGQRRQSIVQVALIAETESLQQELATYGIPTQIPEELAPIQIHPSGELSAVYAHIGCNSALGLSGRPIRRLRSLTTSRIFRIAGEHIVFLPSFLDPQKFYLTLDYHFLVAQIRSELAYIHRHWNAPGRPTVTLLLTHELFELGHRPIHESPLLKLIQELKGGTSGEVPVLVGPLYQLMLTAGTERIDDIGPYRFTANPVPYGPRPRSFLPATQEHSHPLSVWQMFTIERGSVADLLTRLGRSRNLYEHIEILARLQHLEGLNLETGYGPQGATLTVEDWLEEVYTQASQWELWLVVRRAAGLLGKMDVNLSDAVTELVARQKQVTVGKAYSEDSLIRDPMPHSEIMHKINTFCSDEDERDRVLTQEVLVYLSVLIKSEPELFEGLLTLRVGYLILLLTGELAREQGITRDEAYDRLTALSPHGVQTRLRQVLAGYSGLNRSLFKQESLPMRAKAAISWGLVATPFDTAPQDGDWWRKRQIDGELTRLPEDFYQDIWLLLQHCQGIVIGDKLDRRNRIDSDIVLAEMTPGEANFARRLEHLLNKIQAPEYRHVTVEALRELAAIFRGNPDLHLDSHIVLDVLTGHAVRIAWVEQHPQQADHYEFHKAQAWSTFYQKSPEDCARYIAKSLQFLVELAEAEAETAATLAAQETTAS